MPCGCQTLPEAQRTQGIDFVTWVISLTNYIYYYSFKFGHEMLSLTYLATRWHHLRKLHCWPPDGTTRISHKVVHQMDRHSHFTFICIILSDRTGLYCFTAWADIHGNYSWVSWDLLKGSVCDENKKMNKTSSKTFSETHFDISVANFCDTGSNFFKKCTRGYLKKRHQRCR